ncbi:hypothetical protein [Tsukamurella sp. PLM1]|uniref:hypothetical protein n=1 Tax=Tsukamurella sp. PLM1 TaxID=2929795 RepID=UPI00205E1FF4|nr:hypothetical protein [Tsukamurella sp. PLM1]BDH58652.1 hypothetical protein MTP03_35910 [Tsukamurella sp. PLM1]
MTASITFRPDEEARRALDELVEDGSSVSAAIRDALIAAADRRRRERLRAEVAELAADPEDRAELARIREDMDAIRAW